jgi:hypothetical protein
VKELTALQDHPRQGRHQVPTPAPKHAVQGSTSLGGSQWSSSTSAQSGLGPAQSTSSQFSSADNSTKREVEDIVDQGVITSELAQALLNRFRANAIRQFPFVVIPDDATLEDVRKQTPFLFLVVAAVMLFDNPFLQHQLGEQVHRQALQRFLSGTEKSLDLLQGLLVYTAWYCHFYQPHKHQEFLLSQLCVTLAHDLGLDRIKRRTADRLDPCKPVYTKDPSSSLINAQMRAYLGTYCISCL